MLAINKVMREKSEHLKCGALLLLALAIFLIDCQLPLGIAIGMVYAVPLLLTLWIRDPRCPLRFALLFTVLILMGFLKPFPENIGFNIVVVNRTLSILIVWLCMFFVLITKRRTSELQESEERFRELAENIGDVFWITDPGKSKIQYISPAYEHIWGRPHLSLYAAPNAWLEAVHPED
ncbi:MAG: PAS domain-containing protein, partial [Elusimicrobiota bacterium]